MNPNDLDKAPDLSDLKSLVQQLNQSGRQNDIKQRRAKIDALIDEDFATLKEVLNKLAQ